MKLIHSYWAYIVVFLLVIAVINAFIGLTSKKEFKDKDLRISLFALIVMHIQLIIGLGWYFMSPWYKSLKEVGMREAMKSSELRFQSIEHPIIMILAIFLITVGWSKHKKKSSDIGKFRAIAVFYGLALVLVLTRIPWGQWFNL